jgi:hypothetical protein
VRIAIFSRPGACFPNIISLGLRGMLNDLGIENKIFYDSIPMLMRLLPLSEKPKRWHNNLQFRIRNKITHYFADRKLMREISKYDAIILSECYPNAFWKNFFAIKELRNRYKGCIISYTESPLDSAPLNKKKQMNDYDYDELLYDYNLFVTGLMEVKTDLKQNQAVIGVNLDNKELLKPTEKDEFFALIDFAQPGYETQRKQQLSVLKKLGVKYIALEGRYPIDEIRRLYSKAAVFFLAFPETFGLPISECLACGTYVFTPNSSWPMAWRLDENPVSMGPGLLPACFQVYDGDMDLENKLKNLMHTYNLKHTPEYVFNNFIEHYGRFYFGEPNALLDITKKMVIGGIKN